MSDERKRGAVLPVVVTLAVLLCLYVGAYYGTVRPSPTTASAEIVEWYRIAWEPNYDWKYQAWASRVFAPIVWLDRPLRPHVWGGP